MNLRQLVEEKLSDPQECSGHCKQNSTAKFLKSEPGQVLVGHSCPSGYLSRLALYGENLDLSVTEAYLKHMVGESEDIRLATRYSWDLSTPDGSAGKVVRVAYWRQNYRRRKIDDPSRTAVFLCAECMGTFSQPLTSEQVLCENCRKL